jgi:cytochrome c-type biogenesis protein CcmH
MSRAIAAVIAALALAAPLTPAVGAVEPKTTLNAVEAELMCDTCRVPLNVAESPRADQEREEIRQLVARGRTKQQILDRFAAEYGNDVLAVPKGGGASVTVWAVPAAIVVAVAVGLLIALPRWRRRPPSDPGESQAALGADDEQRLARDIAAYDL